MLTYKQIMNFIIILQFQARYKKIADANIMALNKAGSQTLSVEFEAFFKLALEGAKD
jgi:hypothetical protein